jgi:hypothetical protein
MQCIKLPLHSRSFRCWINNCQFRLECIECCHRNYKCKHRLVYRANSLRAVSKNSSTKESWAEQKSIFASWSAETIQLSCLAVFFLRLVSQMRRADEGESPRLAKDAEHEKINLKRNVIWLLRNRCVRFRLQIDGEMLWQRSKIFIGKLPPLRRRLLWRWSRCIGLAFVHRVSSGKYQQLFVAHEFWLKKAPTLEGKHRKSLPMEAGKLFSLCRHSLGCSSCIHSHASSEHTMTLFPHQSGICVNFQQQLLLCCRCLSFMLEIMQRKHETFIDSRKSGCSFHRIGRHVCCCFVAWAQKGFAVDVEVARMELSWKFVTLTEASWWHQLVTLIDFCALKTSFVDSF